MAGVRLKYIDIPPNILDLRLASATHINTPLSQFHIRYLIYPRVNTANYATFEKNYWKLDGTFRGAIGGTGIQAKTYLVWSDDVSSGTASYSSVVGETLILRNYAVSTFTNAPTIDKRWNSYQSSSGVYIGFHGPDFCTDLNIKWYRDNTLLEEKNFYPNTTKYFCSNSVELFNGMVITFNAMNRENRFLKIEELRDGRVLDLTAADLRDVHIIEEYDPISDALPINEMNVEFSRKIDDLDLLFQSKQVMETYLDDTLYGRFFIDGSDTKYNVRATDYIGLLDKSIYLGDYFSNVSVEDILADIFSDEPDIVYDLPTEIGSRTLTGLIPKCTKREALALVLFPLRCYVDDSRTDTLIIRENTYSSDVTYVPKDKTFLSTGSEEYSSPVTEIQLTLHKYTLATDSEEIFSSDLDGGTYTIEFSGPTVITQITGAQEISSSAMYVKIQTAANTVSHVVITGRKYSDTTVVVSKTNPLVALNTPANVISYLNKTLSESTDSNFAENMLNALMKYHTSILKYGAKVKSTAELHSLTGLYPDKDSEAYSGVAVKYDYKLRRNQIGTLTVIANYEGNE